MIFDEDTMTRIHYEIKTETRRLYNPNRRPAVPGHTHKIKIDRTPNTWGGNQDLELRTTKVR